LLTTRFMKSATKKSWQSDSLNYTCGE
jgi:hypothetical protein